ncbi:NAD(P)-binding protein [Dissoconium aciculare CBS 342.82]|uniref:NAD(P)-binding protein n=1 Tax=Dissoconium aciculare CBS 342.82 TaxID=1314786 RepID=A0A6J3LRK8_9PEZI|nr:NAD(P)-binding protein [Dissoconium aciculare CBS 342.82]KAF1818253.1 NAD(P)-binding protein [Dissoconium aciculare CBS 342.82]
MSSPKFLKNVAIVGAGGNSGKFMAEALVAGGKHTVTAITRHESKSPIPSGVQVAKVDYDDHESLVAALKGQDALIITLGVTAPHDQQRRLLRAAAEAKVPWVLPNEWSPDTEDEGVVRDVRAFTDRPKIREEIAAEGKLAYISVTTGFWYEWSVPIPSAFGFDIDNRTATLFDEGETPISVSTWPQIGRAVAALLSLPSDKLEAYRNKQVYINSFTITQKEMLASLQRVTGTSESDWTIIKQSVTERYSQGQVELGKGDRVGFVKMMYSRIFFPDGNGNFEKRRGLANAALGLPKEDLDEATKRATDRGSAAYRTSA